VPWPLGWGKLGRQSERGCRRGWGGRRTGVEKSRPLPCNSAMPPPWISMEASGSHSFSMDPAGVREREKFICSRDVHRLLCITFCMQSCVSFPTSQVDRENYLHETAGTDSCVDMEIGQKYNSVCKIGRHLTCVARALVYIMIAYNFFRGRGSSDLWVLWAPDGGGRGAVVRCGRG
jgi:hypothetical protein